MIIVVSFRIDSTVQEIRVQVSASHNSIFYQQLIIASSYHACQGERRLIVPQQYSHPTFPGSDSRKRPRIESSTADNITLHCVAVRGHDLGPIFPQRIQLADTVAVLVENIKSKLTIAVETTVHIFKVSLSEGQIDQAREPEKIQGAERISLTSQLSELFETPDKGVIHIIVVAPPSEYLPIVCCRRHRLIMSRLSFPS